MKKIVYFAFIFFISFLFIGKVEAATRCQYEWDATALKVKITVILETEGSSTKLTKITDSSTYAISIADDIELDNGKCPSVSFYHGPLSGQNYVHKNNQACKDKQSSDKSCTENIAGKLIESDRSTDNLAGRIQLKKVSSSDSSCKYDASSNLNANATITITKNNGNVNFGCSVTGSVNCEVNGNSSTFLKGDTLNCPAYIYVSGGGDEITQTFTIDGTGTDADIDTSHPLEPKKEAQDINDLYDTKWSNEEGCVGLENSRTLAILKQILNYLQLAAVALLLVLGSLDFAGAVMSDKDDAMKQAGNKFIKRLIASVVVFLVPVLVNIILFIADKSETVCGLLS